MLMLHAHVSAVLAMQVRIESQGSSGGLVRPDTGVSAEGTLIIMGHHNPLRGSLYSDASVFR